ncbi:MAG: FAD-binding oxidoreductase [Methylococcales bacterium]|nr:FAD-binding oxidoreductase [Methylococcales bacterium]
MELDHLIIGQGLAGSLLAWELIRRGSKVIIVDNGLESASQVAAGLINPITGKRLVKSSDVDHLLPIAKQYYAQLAETFAQTFYIEKPMLRLFRSDTERALCHKRFQDPAYHAYLDPLSCPDDIISPLVARFGYVQQKQTGYLLTVPLLQCLKSFFIDRGCYRLAAVDYQDIQLQPTLSWQAYRPKQLIFCEGYLASQNPWFSWLPFQLAKGEILTLAHQSQLPDNIINFGEWLIPLTGQLVRLGASFDHKNLNTQATEQGKHDLLTALKPIWADSVNALTIKHQAHIRPCTLDKQPFLGFHPHYPQLALFNGFGAKGSLQIPSYCQRFADALIDGSPVPSAIQRHYATHFPT